VGDHQRLGHHPAAVTDLFDLGVEEQIWVGALQRPGSERVHVLIQRAADAADFALAHAQAEALDELIDAPGRNAADVTLLNDREQRLLGAPPRLQKRREVTAAAQLGDLQFDRPRPRLPLPGPITIAMRHPILGPALAALGTDLR
jgi:hypothetical protein